MRVNFAASAVRDLTRIRRHIALDNPIAAKRMAERLIAACTSLGSFPMRGRLTAMPPIRELTVVRPYVIAYRIDGEAVTVLRIWHAAQLRLEDQ